MENNRMEKSIEELVILAGKGDQTAANELYNRSFKKAYFVAKSALKSADGDYSSQIEDILQDAYVKVFRNLSKLENAAKFQGWLDTIVINECRNFLKKKKPKLFSDMDTKNSEDGSALEFEDSCENDRMEFKPEESVDYSETKRLIAEMLDRMPAEQKMCLLMYYYEEMSVRQIAEAMDCSEGTIKSRLNYARKNLKGQVLELEKKGTKLYCMPLLPFLFWFFREEAEGLVGGMAAGSAAVAGASTGSLAAGTSGTSAGGTGSAGNVGNVAASTSANTVAESGSAAGGSVTKGAALGAKSAAAVVGKSSIGLGVKLAIAAVGAAAVVGGGAAAVKMAASAPVSETEATTAVVESSTEATEAAEPEVITEPVELFGYLGLTRDEVKEKYGEPTDSHDTQYEEGIYSDWRYSNGIELCFAQDDCYSVTCDIEKAFGITQKTDIHELIDMVGGQVVFYNYWRESYEVYDKADFMWSSEDGQTEVGIVTRDSMVYDLYLDNPAVLDPKNGSDTVVISKINENEEVLGYEDVTADFEESLRTFGYADDQLISDTGMTAGEIRKALYLMVRSMFSENSDAYKWNEDGLYKAKWKYEDLDGDGVEEILFASGSYHFATVGVGKMIDGKAVYCGQIGNNGSVFYYPGTGYFIDTYTGGGGHTESLSLLSGSEIKIVAQVDYGESFNETTEDFDFVGYSGLIDGTEVSPEEAQQYIDNIREKYGERIEFAYHDDTDDYLTYGTLCNYGY